MTGALARYLISCCRPQFSCGVTGLVRAVVVALFVLLLLLSGRAQATCGDYLLHVPREIKVEGVLAFEVPGEADPSPVHPAPSPCANGECRPAPAPAPEPPPLPERDRTAGVLPAGDRAGNSQSPHRLSCSRSVRALAGAPLAIDRPPRQSSPSC